MSIPREATVDDAEIVDRGARPVGPIHPGVILDEAVLRPLGLSAYALAGARARPAPGWRDHSRLDRRTQI